MTLQNLALVIDGTVESDRQNFLPLAASVCNIKDTETPSILYDRNCQKAVVGINRYFGTRQERQQYSGKD